MTRRRVGTTRRRAFVARPRVGAPRRRVGPTRPRVGAPRRRVGTTRPRAGAPRRPVGAPRRGAVLVRITRVGRDARRGSGAGDVFRGPSGTADPRPGGL